METDYMSGNSSPASSSFYGDSIMGTSGDYPRLPSNAAAESWTYRSSSPANVSGLMLPSVHRSSSSLYTQNLELRVQKLEKENSLLRTEADAIKSAYHELVQAVPALLAATSNPFKLPLSEGTSPHEIGPSIIPLPSLSRDDYPDVRFWFRSDFEKPAGGVSNKGAPNPHGRTLASQGKNVSGTYIEDKDGQMVDGFRVTAMGQLAQRIWFSLLGAGKAPPTWGQVTSEASTLYTNEMCRNYPELRYCADNWKAHRIATLNYPSWIGLRKDQLLTTAGHEGGKRGRRSRSTTSAPVPVTEPRKKVKLDDIDLLTFSPLWQPPAPPGTSSQIPGSTDTPAQAPVLTDTSTLEATLGEPGVSGMSCDVPVAAPAPQEVSVSIPAVMSGDASGSQAVDTLLGSPDSTPQVPAALEPPLVLAVVPSTEGDAAHAALILSAFPPQLLPAEAAQPGPVATHVPAGPSKRAKKDTTPKMTTTNHITPRNLCAIEWVSKNRNGTRPEYTKYWDSIKGTNEGQHWIKLAAARKKNAEENAAVATA
ncbi:hypothetical protein FB451DRAFT_1441450 [Mycena latifolia]|nr:hypothetical protein FB451DRAFT_1441450 [Mycena latifolia]